MRKIARRDNRRAASPRVFPWGSLVLFNFFAARSMRRAGWIKLTRLGGKCVRYNFTACVSTDTPRSGRQLLAHRDLAGRDAVDPVAITQRLDPVRDRDH